MLYIIWVIWPHYAHKICMNSDTSPPQLEICTDGLTDESRDDLNLFLRLTDWQTKKRLKESRTRDKQVDRWTGASNPQPHPMPPLPHTHLHHQHLKTLVFPLFDPCWRTDRQTKGPRNKSSYRFACRRGLKSRVYATLKNMMVNDK